jgi:phosphatidylglycerophosphatase A
LGTGVYTDRRKIVWKKVRGFKASFALLVATALGAGLFPIAPGTMGTLIALPLAYATRDWSWPIRVMLWVALTALGTWSAKVFDETMGTNDNQNIVIDEVIGLGITAWTAGNDLKTWIAAFFFFRVFDILKPPPVRGVDQWSKKQASPWWGGFGVIADDMIAGFEGLGVILLLQWMHILPR